ncbi:MAG: hypothetical protein Q7J72_06865 [Candidatus Omnitrophota bacterium]|nr:hypothetical protein [Candidatus Omnitrophota bacterium]
MREVFNYRRYLNVIIACAALCGIICGCASEKNNAMSLQFFDEVYVPVDMMTFLSMDEALKEHGYGNVRASNTETVYTYIQAQLEGGDATALVIYTDISFIPSGSSFQPMRVRQCYETVISDDKAGGVFVNPESAKGYVISQSDIEEALPKLPKKEPLAWAIHIKQ